MNWYFFIGTYAFNLIFHAHSHSKPTTLTNLSEQMVQNPVNKELCRGGEELVLGIRVLLPSSRFIHPCVRSCHHQRIRELLCL